MKTKKACVECGRTDCEGTDEEPYLCCICDGYGECIYQKGKENAGLVPVDD